MALSISTLQGLIEQQFISAGWDLQKSTQASNLALSIATAVVNHIQSDAEVIVDSGSSAGTYGVK